MLAPKHPVLSEAFRRLDTSAILANAGSVAGPDDAARLAIAFAELSEGDLDTASELLASLEGDGSATAPDVAYVRGFLHWRRGDWAAAAAAMEPMLGAADATHDARMRLRSAEARIKLGHHEKAAQNLGPLLEPPGGPDTLEAHFLLLETMLRAKVERKHIIEETSVLDALLERGFAIREAENVLYAGQLLSDFRIDGLQEKLYAMHAPLIDAFLTDDKGVIGWLVAEGQKHRAGALVRAAARSYEKAPFPWESGEPEAAAFQFAHHEEFGAAALVFEKSFDAAELHADGDLWGPYILCLFHGERWADVLEAMDRHAADIQTSRNAAQNEAMRAVALHHLGRHTEAVAIASALDGWASLTLPHEAAVLPKSLMALGRADEARARAATMLDERGDDPSWSPQFLNALVNDALLRGDGASLLHWSTHVPRAVGHSSAGVQLDALADLALSWSMPHAAAELAALARGHGAGARADLMEARVGALNGDLGPLERLASGVGELAGDASFHLARALATMSRPGPAAEAAAKAAVQSSARLRHVSLELLARLLEPIDPARAETARAWGRKAVYQQPGITPEAVAMRENERRHALDEDAPATLRRRIEEVRAAAPASSEITRLERRLATAFPSNLDTSGGGA